MSFAVEGEAPLLVMPIQSRPRLSLLAEIACAGLRVLSASDCDGAGKGRLFGSRGAFSSAAPRSVAGEVENFRFCERTGVVSERREGFRVSEEQSRGRGMGEGHGESSTIDLVAGAVAGGVARTVVSPLDVIKIRFQVQLEPTSKSTIFSNGRLPGISKYTGVMQAAQLIVREEGIRGLWRGNVPALLLQMPYTAIQFVVISKFKTLVSGSPQAARYEGLMSYVGGSLAGCAATCGSYPFDLLRTVLASQGEPKVYPNMRSAMVDIYRRKGVLGLYAGLTPTLMEIVPYAGLQFGFYDSFQRWTRTMNQLKEGSELSKTQKFFCGFGAGLFAKLCCHPLDVIKKRYQVEGLMRDLRYGARIEEKSYNGMFHAIRRILAEEGLKGLYKGTLPSLVKAAPNAAITFYVYESTVRWLKSYS